MNEKYTAYYLPGLKKHKTTAIGRYPTQYQNFLIGFVKSLQAINLVADRQFGPLDLLAAATTPCNADFHATDNKFACT